MSDDIVTKTDLAITIIGLGVLIGFSVFWILRDIARVDRHVTFNGKLIMDNDRLIDENRQLIEKLDKYVHEQWEIGDVTMAITGEELPELPKLAPGQTMIDEINKMLQEQEKSTIAQLWPPMDKMIVLGEDGKCTCSCTDICPLGRLGMQHRCSKEELSAAGVATVETGVVLPPHHEDVKITGRMLHDEKKLQERTNSYPVPKPRSGEGDDIREFGGKATDGRDT